ncbi:DUF6470 family protein [Oscillospiraceae bacterium OttesenSCG-928-G22]|nr:DUF6470 family protein [Oscillospiraceae bacterium OttesenSCG-928-G22]
MTAARILISQTFGQIGLRVTPAQLQVVSSGKMNMAIDNQPPEMEVKRQWPQLHIDQSQVFAECGIPSPMRQAKDYYQRSLGKGMQAIGKRARNGREYLNIENKQNPSATIAKRDSIRYKGVHTVTMPKSRPKMKFDVGGVEIRWKMGDVVIEWNREAPEARYTPYSIELFWREEPKIEIRFEEGSEVHFQAPAMGVGESVDRAI